MVARGPCYKKDNRYEGALMMWGKYVTMAS
jgi:hypothetical protein